jgi:D-amino-acid oxidase
VRTAVVVGAGVSGLTTAISLAEAGFTIKIISAGTDQKTTSYAAGATWSPYLVEFTPRVQAWAFETLDVLRELAAQPGTGVTLQSGVELGGELPEWHDKLAGYAPIDGGYRVTAPVLDMPVYLSYLRRRAEDAGVEISQGHVAALGELTGETVINCAGIGARELVPDASLVPVRGQIVIVDNPGVTEFFVGESDPPVYFFPHGETVALGGTAQFGADRTEPDPDTAAAIIAGCARIDPRLGSAKIVGHRVGLRPTRPTVRLERDGRVIHNYGHGGAGVTLSWGCARAVLAIAGRGSTS